MALQIGIAPGLPGQLLFEFQFAERSRQRQLRKAP